MKKYKSERVGNITTSDRMSVYLAKGRLERSKAFHDALRGVRHWFTGH